MALYLLLCPTWDLEDNESYEFVFVANVFCLDASLVLVGTREKLK